MAVTWTARKYYSRQRSIVCSRIDKGVEWVTRDQNQVVNSFLSTNRWSDRTHEPGVKIIPKDVY